MPRALLIVAALVLGTSVASAQELLVVLTGSTSGVYYPIGNALSAIVTKSIPRTRATVQATQGSVENLRLLNDSDGEIAFTLCDALSDAWKGNPEAGFKAPLNKLRGVAAIYRNYVQLVASARPTSTSSANGGREDQARECASASIRPGTNDQAA